MTGESAAAWQGSAQGLLQVTLNRNGSEDLVVNEQAFQVHDGPSRAGPAAGPWPPPWRLRVRAAGRDPVIVSTPGWLLGPGPEHLSDGQTDSDLK